MPGRTAVEGRCPKYGPVGVGGGSTDECVRGCCCCGCCCDEAEKGARGEDPGGGGRDRTGGRDEATTALRGGRDRGDSDAEGAADDEGRLLDPGRGADGISGILKLNVEAEGTRKDWPEWWWSWCWLKAGGLVGEADDAEGGARKDWPGSRKEWLLVGRWFGRSTSDVWMCHGLLPGWRKEFAPS